MDLRLVIKGINDGTPHISTAAAFPATNEDIYEGETLPLPRTEGTVNEFLFDTVCVDRTNRQIKLYRFGAGSDRTATY